MKTSPKGGQFKKKFKITLFILIVLILVWYFWPKAHVYDPPLPLILPNNLEATYESFSQDSGHNSILLLYGQHGKGKSRTLSHFIDELRKTGRLIFYFDFGSLGSLSNEQQAIRFIQESIQRSIVSRESWLSSSSAFKSANQRLLKDLSDSRFQDNFNEQSDPNSFLSFKNKQIHLLYTSFSRIASGLLSNPSLALSLFYRAITYFSILNPLLVISNPERLHSINFTQFSDFYDLFMYNFISAPASLPRIMEISDYPYLSSLYSNSTFLNHNIDFIPVCVGDFTQDKAKDALSRVFKPLQLHTLFNEFGGHGAAFVKVHELMRDGYSFDQSVKQVLHSYQQKLSQAPRNEIITLLKGEKVTYDQVPVLVDSGIAGPVNLLYMGFSNHAYHNYAKKLIKSLPGINSVNTDDSLNHENISVNQENDSLNHENISVNHENTSTSQ